MVTYGYGEVVKWDAVQSQKASLEEWAKDVCERHSCTAEYFITANYW